MNSAGRAGVSRSSIFISQMDEPLPTYFGRKGEAMGEISGTAAAV